MFRFRNFVLGCAVGVFTALVVFSAGFAIEAANWPLRFDTETALTFCQYTHWGWFGAIVLLGGVWGFLFNNELGEKLSQAERRSRRFGNE